MTVHSSEVDCYTVLGVTNWPHCRTELMADRASRQNSGTHSTYTVEQIRLSTATAERIQLWHKEIASESIAQLLYCLPIIEGVTPMLVTVRPL